MHSTNYSNKSIGTYSTGQNIVYIYPYTRQSQSDSKKQYSWKPLAQHLQYLHPTSTGSHPPTTQQPITCATSQCICVVTVTSVEGATGSHVLLECLGYSITSPSSPHCHSVRPRNELVADISNTLGMDCARTALALGQRCNALAEQAMNN